MAPNTTQRSKWDGALAARSLRCEHAVEPLGVDAERPLLSWVPVSAARDQAQTSYRVLVASTPELLARDVGDRWDSGRVASGICEGVAYDGTPLASRDRCWWKVCLWDGDGEPGAWSETASFELGLLVAEDWHARWIGMERGVSSPLLRSELWLDAAPRRARAYVCGLGYYELRLNGAKVGDRVLDPATTTYDRDPAVPSSEEIDPRALYAVYDVTEQLVAGANAVGLMLGHGWYSAEPGLPGPPVRYHPFGDRPRGLVQLEVELDDGQLVRLAGDAGWKASPGPIVFNDLLDGERYDARLEQPGWDRAGFDDAAWSPAVELEPIAAALRTTSLPPIRVTETLAPVEIAELREQVTIVNFGQNVTGWTRITVAAAPGTAIALRHATRVDEHGELDDASNMARWSGLQALQTDTYVCRGEGSETWEPRFTQHGFRHVEITASGPFSLERVEARVVHAALEPCGSFTCADALLNQIHANVRWTYRATFQGIPQDAAERSERVAWTGETGFAIEDFLYDFDAQTFWAKWLDDLQDAQRADGDVPIVCPLHWREGDGTYGAPSEGWHVEVPDWNMAYALILWSHYRYYGDRSVLERHYDGVRRLVERALAHADGLIVTEGFGDHMEPQPDGSCADEPLRTPIPLTSTAVVFAATRIVADVAELLGDADAARHYGDVAAAIGQAFNERFLDAASGQYGSGGQTALAVPLWVGLVPDEHEAAVVRNLLAEIRKDGGHLATGCIGTAALEHVLSAAGAAEVMYEIATKTTFPSWGNQIARGATTLWETWGDNPAGYSQNMTVYGGIEKFLYADVAGISPAAPGWSRVLVMPSLTHRLASASARVRTVRGEVAIDWRVRDGRLLVELEVPATSRADVWLPTAVVDGPAVVAEGDSVVWREGTERPEYVHLTVGGGSYAFEVGPGANA